MSDFDNGTNEGREHLQKGARTANNVTRPLRKKVNKKAREKTKKAAKKAGEWLSKAAKSAGEAILSLGPEAIAVILVVVIVVVMITSIFGGHYMSSSLLFRLNTKAEIITAMFDSYINETYRQGWYIDYVNGGHLVDANYESVRNTDYDEQGNNTSDRNKYKNIMSFIKNNGYEYELAALWEVLVKDNIAQQIYSTHHDEYRDNGDDRRYSSADATYEGICEFYYYAKDDAYSDEEMNANGLHGVVIKDIDNTGKYFKIGFFSTLEQQDVYARIFHQFYTTQMMKACMDAFVNSDGSYVTKKEDLTKMVNEGISNGQSENSTDSVGFYIDYSDKLTDLIYDNFRRGLDAHTYYMYKDRNNNDELVKYSLWKCVNSWYSMRPMAGVDYTRFDEFIKDDFKNQVKGRASNNIISCMSGSGDVTGLVALAHQQLGNGGQKYCDVLYNGILVDWCAIYAGWLLQEGGNINISDYGWSAGVPSWQRGLQAKGLWHSRNSSYKAKVGDIVMMSPQDGGYAGHVGIVIEVNGNEFTTSEGNTAPVPGSGEWCIRSQVKEYTYSFSDPYIVGFGDVTYASAEGTSGVSSFNLHPTSTDTAYKAMTFKQWKGRNLTDSERSLLENIVTGEYGGDWTGSCLVAQCMRDSLVYGFCDNIMNLPSKCGYSGYSPTRKTTTEYAKKAVKLVFDEGATIVQHRIIVYYATNYCYSAWHETQHYILTYQQSRFFDCWHN